MQQSQLPTPKPGGDLNVMSRWFPQPDRQEPRSSHAPIMTNARTRATQLSSRSSASAGEWLPSTRDQPLLTSRLNLSMINALSQKDWFMRLAVAISGRQSNNVQSRMVARTYLFLREFAPLGLTGKLAHIRGEDVMHHLLSHSNEYASSRHKVTKEGAAAFAELGKWMAKGRGWEEALHANKLEKMAAGKEAWEAPGLHSPAGMLSMLVIEYPETKLKDRARELQLEWMLGPREGLVVHQGFWKGINAANLYTAFAPEEGRLAECALLANYNDIFGENFLRCRRDIRPYLQPWTQGISLAGDPSDVEDSFELESAQEHRPEPPEHTENDHVQESVSSSSRPASKPPAEDVPPMTAVNPIHAILDPVRPHTPLLPQALEKWLVEKLAGHGDVLPRWCKHWAKRIRQAENHQEQLILRSLFIRSLKTLECLSSLVTQEPSVPEAYMLLDMQSEEEPTANQQAEDITGRLEKITVYNAYADITTQFLRLAEGTSIRAHYLMKKICTAHKIFLYNIFTDKTFRRYGPSVISLSTLRMQALLKRAENDPKGLASLGRLGKLLNENTIKTLKLTPWQLRALISSAGGGQEILTDWQNSVFHQESAPPGATGADPSQLPPYKPRPCVADIDDPEKEDTVRYLFGNIQQGASHINSAYFPHKPGSASTLTPQATGAAAPAPAPSSAPAQQIPPEDGPAGGRGTTMSASRESRLFAGKKHVATSQLCSADQRSSKKPRLGDLSQEEWMEDLNQYKHDLTAEFKVEGGQLQEALQAGLAANREQLKQELRADLKAMIEQLREELRTDAQANMEELKQSICSDLKTELFASNGQLKQELQTHESHLQSHLTTELTELKPAVKGLQDHVASFAASIVELQYDLAAMQTAVSPAMQKLVQNEIRVVRDAVNDLKSQSEKVPLAGEKGFLTQRCPAPQGDQTVYESRLFRAAMFYIQCLGSPDDGVGADQDAIEETLEHFLDLPEEHIVFAIEHVHMQAYNRPFVPGGTS